MVFDDDRPGLARRRRTNLRGTRGARDRGEPLDGELSSPP